MSVTDRILTALTVLIRMNDEVEEMAGLMTEQQHRFDELKSRAIRLDTVLGLVLNRSSGALARLPRPGRSDGVSSRQQRIQRSRCGSAPEPREQRHR